MRSWRREKHDRIVLYEIFFDKKYKKKKERELLVAYKREGA